MNIKLTLKERYNIIKILPEFGNMITLSQCDELIKKLTPSKEEIELCDISIQENNVNWKKEIEVDFEFNEHQVLLLNDVYLDLNKNNKLDLGLFYLFKKLFNL